MGKLAQACEDLAEGRRADQAWKRLIGDPASGIPSLIFTECPVAVQNSNLEELELSFKLLATDEAVQQAAKQHQQLFNLETGASRLETIRQAVACAYIAACTRQPLAEDAASHLLQWAPRALGLADGVCPDDLKLSMMETSDSIITRALDAVHHDAKEKHYFADVAARWFAGCGRRPTYELTVPVLLFDSHNNLGTVAELHLKRLGCGTGKLFASPHTRLQVEIHNDTREGIDRAWERVQSELGRSDVDVQWELFGANSISGRSAEAAIQIGLKLLLTGAPYDRQCVVSAMVDEEGNLNHVGGITENGNPKLHAAATLIHGQSGVTVITSPANRLSAPDEAAWKAKGITLRTCIHLNDALTIVSRQLALIEDLLSSQIDLICRQAGKRFDRPIAGLDDFKRYVIPMQVAQGIRPDVDADDDADGSDQAEDIEVEEQSERRVVSWTDFRNQCTGNAIVVGDPGFGKTTLLWCEVAEQCQRTREQLQAGVPIPELQFAFYLPASQLPQNDPSCSVADALVSAINAYSGLPNDIQGFVAGKIAAGQCLLCIDALDEVSDQRITEQFLKRLTADHPGVGLLLSSRLTGFSGSPIEMADDNQVELMPFTRDQIRAVVQTWFDDAELTKKIYATISDGRLSDVLCSPILLNLARGQVADCIASGKPIPTWQRRTELYSDFINLGIRQHRDRTSELFEEMEQAEFPLLLQELALALWLEDSRQTIVSRNGLRQHMKLIIKDREFWGLKDRFPKLLADLQDCGILVPVTVDEEDPRMMFLHRTIGEYLAGKCLARRIEDGDEGAWRLIDKKCWAPEWKQVILFCAGALSDARTLLLRLKDDRHSDDNSLGDDLLRHRLLLAAQCLPELAVREAGIVQDITDQVLRSYRMGLDPLFDEAVDATKALIAIGARFRDKPVPMSLRIETSTACFSPAAHSPDCFEFLLSKLWKACESVDPRMIRTMRPPAPFARALVSICDTIDVEQLRRSPTNPPDQYWRVIGAVFREVSYEKSKNVELNAEFLRYLGVCWFDTTVSRPTHGLAQAVEYLPAVSASVLQESSLLIECNRLLRNSGSRPLQERALTLIRSLGALACVDNELVNTLAELRFSASGRLLTDAIKSLSPALAEAAFIERLAESVKKAEGPRRRTGMEMFVLLGETHGLAFSRALDELLSLPDAKQVFVRCFAESPSRNLTKSVSRLLKSEHRSIALQAVDALAKSTIKSDFAGPVAERLDRLDSLALPLVSGDGHASFDSPETLDLLMNAEELGVRLLLPSFLGLAYAHRPSREIVDWSLRRLSDDTVSTSDKSVIADALAQLKPRLVTYLRKQVSDGAYQRVINAHLVLAALVHEDPDKAVKIIKEANADAEIKLRAIRYLPPDSLADLEIIDLIMSQLGGRSRRKVEFAVNALDSIKAAGVSPTVANAIIRAMSGQNSRELVRPVLRLVRDSPDVFLDPLAVAYGVTDNPGHDDLGEVIPALGNRLVESRLFDVIRSEAKSSDRNLASRAVRLLVRTMIYCNSEHRRELATFIASLSGPLPFGSLLTHDETTPEFVHWILEQFNNPAIVRLAVRLAVDREHTNMHWNDRRSLISGNSTLVPERFPVCLPAEFEGAIQSLARASVSFLRLFRTGDSEGSAITTKKLSS